MSLPPLDYQEEARKCEYGAAELAAGRIRSYSLAGRSFTYDDIPTLLNLARYFMARHAETTCGGVTLADMSGGYD